jgi:hypothetical protein
MTARAAVPLARVEVARRPCGRSSRRGSIVPRVQKGGSGPGASALQARWRADGAGGTCGPLGAIGPRGFIRCGLLNGAASAQGVALELDPMRVVHEAIEDGVGQGRLADHVVPAADRDLAGDQGRGAAAAVLDDLEEIAALLGGHGLRPPVVEDQQVDTGPVEEPWFGRHRVDARGQVFVRPPGQRPVPSCPSCSPPCSLSIRTRRCLT